MVRCESDNEDGLDRLKAAVSGYLSYAGVTTAPFSNRRLLCDRWNGDAGVSLRPQIRARLHSVPLRHPDNLRPVEPVSRLLVHDDGDPTVLGDTAILKTAGAPYAARRAAEDCEKAPTWMAQRRTRSGSALISRICRFCQQTWLSSSSR